MTFDSIEQIKEAIENPINSDMLMRANKIREKHELHVSGLHLDSYIDKIQGIENKNALSLRRALAKSITEGETQKIITVQNKVFTARGGGRFYDFSNDNDKTSFIEILKNVKNGQSMNTFMRKTWKELVNIDPSGLLMGEYSEDNLYLTYKSTESLHDILYSSAQKIEYIIFKPFYDEKDKGILYYRIVDDKNDYLVKVQNKQYSIIDELTYPNIFGFVPATFISDRKDKKSNAFTSHIYECMNYADELLLDHTLHRVYKTKIAIPLHWQYERECAVCEGSGQIIRELNDGSNEINNCSACEGTGYSNYNRDIADIIVLPMPESDDVPLTPPAGYVVPDLETWTKQEETIEKLEKKMYSSVWGESSVITTDRRNITASELQVRDTAKIYKLDEISENEENVEHFLTDLFGVFYYPSTYQGSIVRNGKNYSLKSASELELEYNEALKSGVNPTKLNEILEEYYYTLYKNNPQKLNASLIKLNAKPFYHWPPEKIQNANVDRVDYYKNIYFDEFIVFYENSIERLGISTLERVQNELDKWIINKIPETSINQNVAQNE